MGEARRISFDIEVGRVIDLLANQIYQSPLALLRENAQNAFDAVLLRRFYEPGHEGRVRIEISPTSVVVTDDGIGMTPTELEHNYWSAGSSGKSTPEAKQAGVVGTFGIGAMANFGIAEELTVETESARERVRTRSHVSRGDLSTSRECITLEALEPKGSPGTRVEASWGEDRAISVDEAVEYIGQFVEFVDIPVFVNGSLVSGRDLRALLPSEAANWKAERSGVSLAGLVNADIELIGLAGGELRVVLENIQTEGAPEERTGRAVLTQDSSAIRTFRSGFGLATISLVSIYRFGGAVDLPVLQPTAGREALEGGSNDFLQRVITALDDQVSEIAIGHEPVWENQGFLRWVQQRQRFDLCGDLSVEVDPTKAPWRLADLVARTPPPRFYRGTDASVIQTYATEERPLVVVSRRSPRRECELGYLQLHGVEEVSDQPQLLEKLDMARIDAPHGAVAIRMARVLAEDYFVEASVVYAKMSHDVGLMVEREERFATIYVDPEFSGIMQLCDLYNREFGVFGPFVKDFVRAHVFPRVQDLVPSSSREGAEAFLRRLRGRRELFEIDFSDREDLQSLLESFAHGEITWPEATTRAQTPPRMSVVYVGQEQASPISAVVTALADVTPDPVATEASEFAPLPPVDRRNDETDALLLTGEERLNGYSCFLALSPRAQQQNGEFFLRAHSTSIVWGGQRVLFVFLDHSRTFGLYYDVECSRLVAESSGGGPFRSSTLVLANRIFIPVPDDIVGNFVPHEGERVRLEVRSDVLQLESEL